MSESSRYPIPAGRHRVEEEISRSRFITTIEHCNSPDQAQEFIREMREEFADASHNCWAYNTNAPGSLMQVGMSDDGEPKGTAGRPMLTVLTHSGIGEICAVVTRYFGGTKLGTGGLTRAYSGGVKLALESLPLAEKIDWVSLRLVIDYPILEQMRLLFPTHEVVVDNEEFTDRVSFNLRLPHESCESFRLAVMELSSGKALLVTSDHSGS